MYVFIVHVCMYLCFVFFMIYTCVCVWVYIWYTHRHTHTHTHVYNIIYIYIYICMCVCVSVYMPNKACSTIHQGTTYTYVYSVCVCVCVCVCKYMYVCMYVFMYVCIHYIYIIHKKCSRIQNNEVYVCIYTYDCISYVWIRPFGPLFLEFWHCEDESSSCRCPHKVASHFPKRDTQAPEIHQSTRQHTSAYVSIRQQRERALGNTSGREL
jgi:nuclear pore complex protein Nup62